MGYYIQISEILWSMWKRREIEAYVTEEKARLVIDKQLKNLAG